jgi:hypothetical protein
LRATSAKYEEQRQYFCNQINQTILHYKFQLVWDEPREIREPRNYVQTGAGYRSTNAEAALEARSKALSCGLRFVGFHNGAHGTFVKRDAGFGWGEFASRSNEKTGAQAVLQFCETALRRGVARSKAFRHYLGQIICRAF